ncbi:V-type ATP synthase subunit A [Thermospira aquatica]|uniref:V-type ATP synthase alpha chain n=1 Tax=Thermospira aquatica TaxID=2828656 RepID=A0AAX3BD50_9SPIR|nr:V-type ATP synthase subunit A [Thermospira aquatica]URA10121.1 V-type ATP synthase subunit A [Thermospira aquatica]
MGNTYCGKVKKVNGPLVTVSLETGPQMMEVVYVSHLQLIGEVLHISGDEAVVQVYEDTSGVKPGDDVFQSGLPLSVELGPGIIGNVFDGIQRPLEEIAKISGIYIGRGINIPALSREKKWEFVPKVKAGMRVSGGMVLGNVPETPLVEHRILVPPRVEGEVVWVASAGSYTVEDTIAEIKLSTGEREKLSLYHRWPVKFPRPVKKRLDTKEPLLTGQRIIDMFFPLSRGGTAAVPGGFGTGKTITQHQLAKWADADIIVYIGCGERGNEITEVLEDFPKLIDPKTNRPLMERTILIANTSNMPVTAREASIYTGITLAEYYRDMGYDVALMADSSSRWAEALRELSGRLEEMPAEEGFPAYLGSKLAAFYERAGNFVTLSGEEASISAIGAVSPPGGDFSEPVTQNTKRFVRCFWELDKALASSRHYPSINWMRSYSEYADECEQWWVANVDPEYRSIRLEAYSILQKEDKLQKIVKLIGPDALPDSERLYLDIARLIKIGFLQQSAYDPVDTYSTPEKQVNLLRLILQFKRKAEELVKAGVPLFEIREMQSFADIMRAKLTVPNEDLSGLDRLREAMEQEFADIETEYL